MFMKVFGIGGPAALGAMYMTGNLGGADGVVYDKPVTAVYSSLSSMQMPPEIKEKMNTIPGADLRVDRKPNEQVRWRWTVGGHDVVRVTADIHSLAGGKASSVETELEFDSPDGAVGDLMNSFEGYRGVAKVIIAEQIDATIEGRPFDRRAAQVQAAAYVVTHAKELKADLEKMESLKGLEHDRSSSDPNGPSFRPGQPMVDVSR